jgi:DNA repair exonuclease SbcCD ATPase subunit
MIEKLRAAIKQITDEHLTAETRLAELQGSLSELLSACAMGEVDASRLEAIRGEIIRLQQIVSEPYKKAIEPLEARLKEIRLAGQKYVSLQQVMQTEKEYRQRFNRMMQEPLNSSLEWDWLSDQAEHYHRNDVQELKRLMYAYDTEGRGLAFMEYCRENGFTPYNEAVTPETVNSPRG